MDYENSLDTYTVTFRGVFLLLLVVWIVQGIRASGQRANVSAVIDRESG